MSDRFPKVIEFLFAEGLGNSVYDAEDRVHNISSAIYQEMDKLRDLVRRLQGWVGYEHITLDEFHAELGRHDIAMRVIREAASRNTPDSDSTPVELERDDMLMWAEPEKFVDGGREIFIGCYRWGMKNYLPQAIVKLFSQWAAEQNWTPPLPSYSTVFELWKDSLPLELKEDGPLKDDRYSMALSYAAAMPVIERYQQEFARAWARSNKPDSEMPAMWERYWGLRPGDTVRDIFEDAHPTDNPEPGK